MTELTGLWLGNRFIERFEMPPEGWYHAELSRVFRYREEGENRHIFGFSFAHENKDCWAGLMINVHPYNDRYLRLQHELVRTATMGRMVLSSELVGKPLDIQIEHKYSKVLKVWFLNVADFRGSRGD